jgi:hypothetical protein
MEMKYVFELIRGIDNPKARSISVERVEATNIKEAKDKIINDTVAKYPVIKIGLIGKG